MEDGRLTAPQRHAHQVIAAPLLHHPQPALAAWIDQPVGKGPRIARIPRHRQLLRRGNRRRPGLARQVETPEAAIAIVDEHHGVAGHRIGTAPVFVDAAAQVPGPGGEVTGGGFPVAAHHQGGAAPFPGTLLQPEQSPGLQPGFLDHRSAAQGHRRRQRDVGPAVRPPSLRVGLLE